MRSQLMLVVLLGASACPPAVIVVPDLARVRADECVHLYAEGDLDQAEAACDQALEFQPKFWDALHNKGLIRLKRGDRAQAKALFIAALRANQDMAASYSMLGLLALEDRDFATAKDHFRAALRVNPDFMMCPRALCGKTASPCTPKQNRPSPRRV
jgi:tetratricopeptide (TPR) repeat protein